MSRQTRKRLATRQAISDTATRLFFERGFDRVTVDEIAEAADVGRMTVFNHFRRKEDMFFDLDDEMRADMVRALQDRGTGVGPVEAFRLLAHRAIAERRDYVSFSPGSQRFIETMEASPALMARWRTIRDETADALALALPPPGASGEPDADARLAASLMTAAWTVAAAQGQVVFRSTQEQAAAEASFLRVIDRGCKGAAAAMAGTAYA